MTALLGSVSRGLGVSVEGPRSEDVLLKEPKVKWNDSAEASSEQVTFKRRAKGSGGCQVPGCDEEIPTKIYYQRHRICLRHASLPGVVLDGKGYRWCQQCGRFQSLDDFCGDRKTCRRVLDQHNARRRKRTADRAGSRRAQAVPSPTGSTCAAEDKAAAAQSTQLQQQQPEAAAAPKAKAAGRKAAAAAAAALSLGAAAPGAQASRAASLASEEQLGVQCVVRSTAVAAKGVKHESPFAQHAQQQPAAPQALPAASEPQLCAAPPAQPCVSDSTRLYGGEDKTSSADGSGLAGSGMAGSGMAGSGITGMEIEGAVLPIEEGPELTSRMLEELMTDADLQGMLGYVPDPEAEQLQDEKCLEPLLLSQEDLMQLTDPIFSSLLLCSLPTPGEGEEGGCGGADCHLGGAAGFDATMEAEAQEAHAHALLASRDSSSLTSPFSHLPAAHLDQQQQQQQLSITAQHTASLHTPSITSVGSGCATSATPTPPPPFVPSPSAPTHLGLSPWEQHQHTAATAAHQHHHQQQLLPQAFQMADVGADGMDQAQCLPWGPQDAMQGVVGADEVMPAMGEGWQAVGNRLPVLQPRAPVAQQHAQQPQHSPVAAQQMGMPTFIAPQQQQQQQQHYGEQQEYLVRLSLKLFNVTPEDLPVSVRQEVLGLVSADPLFVDSFIRPGCTHVTVMALLCAAEHDKLCQSGAKGVANQLLQRSGGEVWAADMLVQLNTEVAVVREGQVMMVVGAEATAPQVVAARPTALMAPASGGRPASPHGSEQRLGNGVVALWGYNISGSHDMVVCRQGGRVLNLEMIARGKAPVPASATDAQAGRPAPEWVLVKPLHVTTGLLQFEVQRGGLLSGAVSMPVLPSAAAVEEAQQAQRMLAGTPAGATFLQNVGLVLQLQQQQRAQQPQPVHPLAAQLAARLAEAARAQGWVELLSLLEHAASELAAAARLHPAAAAAPGLAPGQHSVAVAAAPAAEGPRSSAHEEDRQAGSSAEAKAAAEAEAVAEAGVAETESGAGAGAVPACQVDGENSAASASISRLSEVGSEEELVQQAEGSPTADPDSGSGGAAGSPDAASGDGSGRREEVDAMPNPREKSCDYGEWVAVQLRRGRESAQGLARKASLHGSLAVLVAVTGATLLLRDLLGEV